MDDETEVSFTAYQLWEQAVAEHSDNDYTYADEDDTEDRDDTEEDEDDCPFDGAVDTEEDSLADIVEEMEDAPTVRKKADYSNYKTPPLSFSACPAPRMRRRSQPR